MFPHRRLGSRTRALLLAASIVLVAWQMPALAQSADPSDRIATITDAAGNLSFAPAGSDDWAQAGLNRPITTGDRLWVDNGGRAELHAGSTAIRLGSGTAVTMLNLDDSATQVKLNQGTLQLRVRALPPDQPVEIDTPNLAFVPKEPGDYRLDVAADGSGTVVTMRHGSAVVYGDNRSLEMRRGDQTRFAGTDLAEAGSATNPPLDGFDRWTIARDAREDNSPSARYVPPEMTGYAALDNYGDWQEDPGYGAVWFPRVVAAGWAPYSAGYWAWVAPWGWTWCDDAPWGFAPSHYGRWARIGDRWGWMPGPRSVRPVYAPALVGFIDDSHGHDHDHDRGRGPGVAWYPLGPREAYRPAYGASPAYVNRINRFTANNEVINNRIRNTYVNREVPEAITGMPARAFVQGQRVPPGARSLAWRDLPRGEANGAPPLAPVKASLRGAAPARAAPPAVVRGFERPAIAARAPGRPASDELAQRLARTGGTVPGAGPVWRGAGNAPGGNQAAPAPVRLSQAAPAYHGHGGAGQMQGGPVTHGVPGGNPGNPAFGPQRAEGGVRPPAPQGLTGAEHGVQPPAQGGEPRARGWTMRPDQARGLPPQNGQSAAQPQQAQQSMQQQQEMQRQQQQRQLGDQQRAQQSAQQQQEMQRQQQQRQLGDQQRAQQSVQQQQEMQRQQQQRQLGDQQRAQQSAQQQQEMQRQQQQRQLGDQQRAQQSVQQQQEMQRQQQERQLGDQQRAQQAAQQQQEMQRQQQQRQLGDQQRAQQSVQQQQEMQRQQQQRQLGDQQRAQQAALQQQEMQRQQQERQMQDQQRAQQAMQQQQQRQMQEQQRQQQAIQQQAMQQQAMQRQQQEMQRQQQEQQRQQQLQQQQQQQQQQQVMQRQQQDQQRQQQEMQRQQQDHQRQQQEQQRRQQDLQRQQQHAVAQPQAGRQS